MNLHVLVVTHPHRIGKQNYKIHRNFLPIRLIYSNHHIILKKMGSVPHKSGKYICCFLHITWFTQNLIFHQPTAENNPRSPALGQKVMCNLIYNRRRSERSDQNTSWRQFSSVEPRKRSCTFFYRIYPKENIAYAGVLQIFHTKNRWDIENFAFDVWW
jgi:hypothetical protein